jgi:hypothetical protein
MTSLETADKIASIIGAVAGVAGAMLAGVGLYHRAREGRAASDRSADSRGRPPVRLVLVLVGVLLFIAGGGALWWGSARAGPRYFDPVSHPDPLTVQLDTSEIPQRSFDHETLDFTTKDDRGFSIECRMPPDPADRKQNLAGCRPGTVPAYHLVPSPETGTKIALSSGGDVSDPDPCHGVAAGSDWVRVTEGKVYCLFIASELVLIKMAELPSDVPVGTKSVRIEMSAWTNKA